MAGGFLGDRCERSASFACGDDERRARAAHEHQGAPRGTFRAMVTVWHATRCAMVVVLALGCSGKSASSDGGDGDGHAPPTYSRSPIVFSTLAERGTFLTTVERPVAERITPHRNASELSLSPSRRLFFQRSDHADAFETDIAAELFELTPNGRLVTTLPPIGEAFGWTLDDELIYGTATTLLRVGPDGTIRSEVPFPVDRLGLYRELSPDGSAVAFVTDPITTGGDFLEVIDVQTGAELANWELPEPAGMIWASNGTIVLPTHFSGLYTATLGDPQLAGPFALPFRPCALWDWVDPNIVRMSEVIVGAPCGGSWLVRTDGTSAVKREEINPVAFSPDRTKLLTVQTSLIVTDLDLGNPIELPSTPNTALPIVW